MPDGEGVHLAPPLHGVHDGGEVVLHLELARRHQGLHRGEGLEELPVPDPEPAHVRGLPPGQGGGQLLRRVGVPHGLDGDVGVLPAVRLHRPLGPLLLGRGVGGPLEAQLDRLLALRPRATAPVSPPPRHSGQGHPRAPRAPAPAARTIRPASTAPTGQALVSHCSRSFSCAGPSVSWFTEMLLDVHGHPPMDRTRLPGLLAALERWDSRFLLADLGASDTGWVHVPEVGTGRRATSSAPRWWPAPRPVPGLLLRQSRPRPGGARGDGAPPQGAAGDRSGP